MQFYIIKLLHEYLKKKPLSKVTRKDYQNFRGKDASYNTVKRTHSYIQTARKDALHDGLIDKDPTHNAVIYYENKPNNQRNHWNEQEFEELIKVLRSEITLNNCMLIIQAGKSMDWAGKISISKTKHSLLTVAMTTCMNMTLLLGKTKAPSVK